MKKMINWIFNLINSNNVKITYIKLNNNILKKKKNKHKIITMILIKMLLIFKFYQKLIIFISINKI